jgi:hypothetical protein
MRRHGMHGLSRRQKNFRLHEEARELLHRLSRSMLLVEGDVIYLALRELAAREARTSQVIDGAKETGAP